MFEEIEIRDLSKYIDENTKLICDCDGIAFKNSSMIDELFIEVVHKSSGRTMDFENVTAFKGNVRTAGKIGSGSWLHSTNLKREVNGQRQFALDEFDIIQKTKQKLGLNIATKNVDSHIEMLKEVTGIADSIMLLGSGNCFRHGILLPTRYKESRLDKPRPSQLINVRQHIIENHITKHIRDGINEADDILEMYAWKGYCDYLKTGKFSYLVSSFDKDATGTPSLLLNWDKEGSNLKYPYPWLIPDTSKDIGKIDIIKGTCKAYGFLQIIYQMLAGDNSDGYNPRMVKGLDKKDNFGDESIYKLLSPLKTPQELIEFTVSKYKEWYPEGLHYVAWNGTEINQDIYWWLEQMFACVYMKRSTNDKTTFKMLMDKFGIPQEAL